MISSAWSAGLRLPRPSARSARPSRCRPSSARPATPIASTAASSGPEWPARQPESTPAAAAPSSSPDDRRPVHGQGRGPAVRRPRRAGRRHVGPARVTGAPAGQRHGSEQRDRQPQSSPGHGTRAYGHARPAGAASALPVGSAAGGEVAERPYVLLSAAMSADGYIDDASAARLVLSDAADLDRVDELRAAATPSWSARRRSAATIPGCRSVRRRGGPGVRTPGCLPARGR